MPCFKGIAVSIHANGAPLPEHGINKQSRFGRINSYIPVPEPQLTTDSGKAEPAKFAISITLLTPGLAIPYSTPKPTEANPYPKPHLVGELPSVSSSSSSSSSAFDPKFSTVVTPYIPMTNSENETIAAYIYFDGRAKEEVATLLRPGEETWVNSRWVQVPEAEGGGLAEREFLFREVGLERWLNGLDLEGDDAKAKLEKRRLRFEKRRRRQAQQKQAQAQAQNGGSSSSSGGYGGFGGFGAFGASHQRKSSTSRDTLRYGGANSTSPVEPLDDDDSLLSDDDDSDDDSVPEATGQIKVAMFRVLASGEIKKGEYSPQFDAHDDDDAEGSGNAAAGVDADVEHTTSFAKPKTLDPKTISTQTVTGIDGPEKPYATFTFFYRGERQLQKMGLLPSSKNHQTPTESNKRRSAQLDFSNIGPLKTAGTVGFSTFRDNETDGARHKKVHKRNGSIPGAVPGVTVNNHSSAMDEDSDDDDDDDDADNVINNNGDADDKIESDKADSSSKLLAPDDAKFTGELADGVNRIRLKRQHSAEPDSAANSFSKSPTPTDYGSTSGALGALGGSGSRNGSTGDASVLGTSAASATSASGVGAVGASSGGGGGGGGGGGLFGKSLPDDSVIGSPLKKHRASLAEGQDSDPRSVLSSGAFPPALGDILAKAEAAHSQGQSQIGSVLGSSLPSGPTGLSGMSGLPGLSGVSGSAPSGLGAALSAAAAAKAPTPVKTVAEEDEDEEL